MNDAATDTQRDYRDTVFLPQTSFPMRGDLPKKEPQILARWDAMDLWGKLRAASAGRPLFILHDGPPYANGNIHIGTALNKIHQGRHQPHPPDGRLRRQLHPRLGLPRPADRVEDRGRLPRARTRTRMPSRSWISAPSAGPMPPTGWTVQAREFRRLGVEGDWRDRYATMDLASEAAIAGEICKFLLNGALYRGLRPVMWSPVEKTALAEAEIEYHDHTSTTIWVRFPVTEPSVPALDGRLGGDLDHHAVDDARQPRRGGRRRISTTPSFGSMTSAAASLARAGEKLVVAEPLLAPFCKDTGITAHIVLHVLKGAELAGTIMAHPLRGRGYEQDTPLLVGDFVTTEAGTGFVHIAPGHGEDDFVLGRANGLDVPETVGDDGTFNAWVPLFAGLHVYRAADRDLRGA